MGKDSEEKERIRNSRRGPGPFGIASGRGLFFREKRKMEDIGKMAGEKRERHTQVLSEMKKGINFWCLADRVRKKKIQAISKNKQQPKKEKDLVRNSRGSRKATQTG